MTPKQDRRNCIWITDADPRYAPAAARLAEAFGRAAVVPFLGAGISAGYPSCLPAAWPLMNVLRQNLWASAWPLTRNGRFGWPDLRAAAKVVQRASLERLLSAMEETHGRDRTIHEYLSPLQGSLWNWNHSALASLAREGLLPCCITLNFDLLIEEAIRKSGGATMVECPLGSSRRHLTDSALFNVGDGNAWTRIIKPHGSFSPLGSGYETSELVATTLPELGDRPDPRNQKALFAVLTEDRELFVAGYSDDDWDVFPIIKECSSRLSHITWVHFAKTETVSLDWCPWDDGRREWERHAHIRRWLCEQRVPFTSFVGDPSVLLRRVNAIRQLSPAQPLERTTPAPVPKPDAFLRYADPQEAQIRTAISMALLLQDRGRFNDVLLDRLMRHSFVLSQPLLQARLHRVLAHTNHTRRALPRAVRHMRHVIALKSNHTKDGQPDIADDLVWLGYETLCLIKRPGLRWLARRKFHRQGIKLMMVGLRHASRSDPSLALKLRPYVRYYRIDLRHTWAGLRLFFGNVNAGKLQRAFAPIARKYALLERDYPDFMGWDYYWLRGLEARLLAGENHLSGVECQMIKAKLTEIDHRYDILQDHVQSGNPQIYLALLDFIQTGRLGRERQGELLDVAQRKWSARGGEARSGLFRVIQFRRYLGLDNPLQTAWRFARYLFRR